MTPLFRTTPLRACALTLISALSSSCCVTHGQPQAKVANDERPAPPAGALRAPARGWATLDLDARKRHMHEVVVPAMAPLFAAYDNERFATFDCRTCHGPNARARLYAMPAPHLPVLYPSGSAEQRATVEQHREMARFMYQQVTPTMRAALGANRYDPASGEGFSCFYCHPRGEPADTAVEPPAL